ncbi:MAG: LysR family transcriptional regulator [Candidatus Krumholzibacteriales bacterium]
MKPGIKLYIQTEEGEGLFGDGKFRLLRMIDESGSIRQASRELSRGYRKAWEDIRRLEEKIGRQVVKRSRGGCGGGSAELTEFGKRMVRAWERYRNEVCRGAENSFRNHIESIIKKEGEK